ncbi:hypothetical protein A8H35_14700 [Burkholderia thailandensis]|nr:hypothetical protein A8H35_14700 [Burkholderia thailandensis]AWY66371.1 hypothetical protein A8H36_13735 [Burkholderia thailandensis]NOK43566.1 hypothetical protein [Burkholderia thailandensis]NOK54480.1 hypothetical protein [Burkholderia thailandensis]
MRFSMASGPRGPRGRGRMHARACCARAGDGLEGSLPDGWPVRDTAARMPGIARPACGGRRRAARHCPNSR